MIRLVQRRLIIPRGDTGSFSIPTIAAASSADIAVFTIFDCLTRSKVFQKTVVPSGDTLQIEFTHNDTVNLVPGNYYWDIKFYKNPVYLNDELVNGDEIDSYYAGFKLPECEIRETGDNMLMSPNAPTGTLTPEQLNIIGSALTALADAVRATEANVAHYPKIEGGYWYVWDSDAGEYVNTNVSASGTAGAQGPVGPAGSSGVYIGTSEPSDSNINVWINPEGQATNIIGVPDGGTTGQVLKKKSNTDYDVEWNNESGAVTDVTIDGTSVVTNGTANIPVAAQGVLGAVKIYSGFGVTTIDGALCCSAAVTSVIKTGSDQVKPIVPNHQHEAAFYGLAKAAGDSTQASSSNTVGTYTEQAKIAIQKMLGIPQTYKFSIVTIDEVGYLSLDGTTPCTVEPSDLQYANCWLITEDEYTGIGKIQPVSEMDYANDLGWTWRIQFLDGDSFSYDDETGYWLQEQAT